MHRVAALVLVSVMVAVGACAETSGSNSGGNQTKTGEGPDEGTAQEAPDFSFETFGGETFSLAEQRGTPVVLNFWESW